MSVTHVPPAQERISYEEHDGLEWSQPRLAVWNGGAVVAKNERGDVIGFLKWYAEGFEWTGQDRGFMIDMVKVDAPYRRLGIATQLLREAQKIEPRVQHSAVRTLVGDAWAKSTGDAVPVRAGAGNRWYPWCFTQIVADVKHIIENEASWT